MYNRMYLHYFSIDVEHSAEVKSQFYDAGFFCFFDRPNIFFFFFFLAYKGIKFVYIELQRMSKLLLLYIILGCTVPLNLQIFNLTHLQLRVIFAWWHLWANMRDIRAHNSCITCDRLRDIYAWTNIQKDRFLCFSFHTQNWICSKLPPPNLTQRKS